MKDLGGFSKKGIDELSDFSWDKKGEDDLIGDTEW